MSYPDRISIWLSKQIYKIIYLDQVTKVQKDLS